MDKIAANVTTLVVKSFAVNLKFQPKVRAVDSRLESLLAFLFLVLVSSTTIDLRRLF